MDSDVGLTVDTRIVLSILTGRLMCEFGDMHEVIEKLAAEPIWTLQLIRVCEELKPVILICHPTLEAAIEEAKQVTKENYNEWNDRWIERYGPELLLPIMADPEEHERIDPVSELAEMGVPPEKTIIIE